MTTPYIFGCLKSRYRAHLPWGNKDREKRKIIRDAASRVFPQAIPDARSWALRIFVRRPESNFDVENVSKTIVDAFSAEQMQLDRSPYLPVSLYRDDTIRHVAMVQVAGVCSDGQKLTRIEIFGRRRHSAI